MRTGMVESGLAPTEQLVLNATLSVFTEEAVAHASGYAQEAGRSIVLPEDLILALKFVSVPSYGFTDQPDIQRRVAEAVIEDGYEADDEGDSSSSEEGTSDEHLPMWMPVVSDDPESLSARMNNAAEEFEAWQPDSDKGRIIKEAICRSELVFIRDGEAVV